MVNKYIGEVAAPEFGPGFTLRLDIGGQSVLETEFGAFDFAAKIQFGLAVMAAEYMLPFLKVSLRKDDVLVKDIPEFSPLEPVARKCLDAFSLFRYGKAHEEWVAENAREVGKTTANPSSATTA